MGKLTIQTKTIPTHAARLQVATTLANDHYARVIADGGTIDSYPLLVEAVQELINIYLSGNLALFIAAAIDPAIFGYKYRTDATGTWCVKAYSLMGAASDVVQATASAQPLLLRWNSTDGNYAILPSASGNNIQTPSIAATEITGDIDISFNINKLAGATSSSFGKEGGTAATGAFYFWSQSFPLNQLVFRFTDGAAFVSYTSTANHTQPFVRVKRIASTGDITFYESVDGITWTQLGAVVASPAGNINGGALPLGFNIGTSVTPTTRWRTNGAQLWNGDRDAGGTLVAEFNAEDYDISVSQNTLTSSTTGEVWSLNRSTATSGYKACLNFRSTIQFDGINDYLKTAGAVLYAGSFEVSEYLAFDLLNLTVGQRIKDGFAANKGELIKTAGGYTLGNGTVVNVTQAANNLKVNIHKWDNDVGEAYVKVNGTTTFTGNTSHVPDGLTLGARGDNAAFTNFIFNSYIAPKQQDSTTIENAVNALMKTWNGNPA